MAKPIISLMYSGTCSTYY